MAAFAGCAFHRVAGVYPGAGRPDGPGNQSDPGRRGDQLLRHRPDGFPDARSTGELRRAIVWLLGGSTQAGWAPVIAACLTLSSVWGSAA